MRFIVIKLVTKEFSTDSNAILNTTAKHISNSNSDLKHGIFSYYLMRGMEGSADTNKDGRITLGEMHWYLTDNVPRQASLSNRVQQTQLTVMQLECLLRDKISLSIKLI